MARTRLRQLYVLSIILGVALAAMVGSSGCGDDSTDTVQTSPPTTSDFRVDLITHVDETLCSKLTPAEYDALVTAAADALIEAQGSELRGFYEALLALDRGYDTYQIMTWALEEGTIRAGRLKDDEGTTVDPTREPEEFLTWFPSESSLANPRDRVEPASQNPVQRRSPPAIFVANGTGGDTTDTTSGKRVTPGMELLGRAVLLVDIFEMEMREREARRQEEAREGLEDEFFHYNVTHDVLTLASRGYSVQQIVEGIVLGKIRAKADYLGEGICHYLEYEGGVILRPINPPVDLLHELSCPPVNADNPTSYDSAQLEAAMGDVDRQIAERRGGGPGAGDDRDSDPSATRDSDGTTTTEAAPSPEPPSRDGEYVGGLTWSHPGKNFAQVTASEARVTVANGRIDGTLTYEAVVKANLPGHPNLTEREEGAVDFTGALDSGGIFDAVGTAIILREFVSCEHADGPCNRNFDLSEGGSYDNITLLGTVAAGTAQADVKFGPTTNFQFEAAR